MSGAGGSIHASAVLRRRVKAEEDHLGGADDDDAYWAAAPRLYDFSKYELKQEQPPLPSPSQAPAPCGGGGHLCLLALQGTGVGWGVRKRVRYVGRHRAARDADHRNLPPAAAAESAVVVQGDEESTSNGKKGDRPEQEKEAEAEESGRDERKVVPSTEKKRKAGRGRGRRVTKRPKKIPPEEREKNLPEEEEEKKAEERSQGERKVVSTEEKRKKPEAEVVAEESGQDEDEREVVRTETKRKRKSSHGRGRGIADQHPKKNRREEETERERKPAAPKVKVGAAGAGARRAMVDRWTAQRYAAAEASLLGIVRAFGACAGQPVPRGKLRQEARKRIGDTGLLDHLLKHAANKVHPGSAERLRRRHNADGAMEYWLEPAELAALRREAGVADPYWVPPPGWKPGDPGSPDACALEVKRQVEELATELAGVKRHMEQLMKAHQGTTVSKEMTSEANKAYISYQEKYDCMVKANGNLEKQVLSLEEKYESATRANGKLEVEVLFLKEKYEAVLEKNTRLEEQMAALSTSFLSLKEDLLLLDDGEQHMLELEQADLSVKELGKAEMQEGHAGKVPEDAAVSAGNQLLAIDDAGDGTDSSSSGVVCGKRTSRKCSVRICKPQGTFQWPEPDTALAHPSSPLTPTAGAAVASLASMDDELHEYMMAAAGGLPVLPPTPPSASSTNAASAKLLLLPAPAPASPVQPPPPSATSPRDVVNQAVQPYSGLGLQLLHTDKSSSAAAPYDVTTSLPEGKKTVLDAGGGSGSVGTELALATPSY